MGEMAEMGETGETGEVSLKGLALALFAQAREAEVGLVESLGPATLAASGTWERWAAKDFIAHISAWKRVQAERLAAAERGETPDASSNEETEEVNARVFAEWQGRPWAAVQAEATAAYEALTARVAVLPEAALTNPAHYAWQVGERRRPLWEPVLGNGAFHPLGHLTEVARTFGDAAAQARVQTVALRANEALVRALGSLSVPDEAEANALYNLACVYAAGGQAERALTLLTKAFRLRPALSDWATQDTDLDGLRGMTAFRTLVGEYRRR